MGRQAICVVDDDEDVRRLLVKVLEHVGFDVVCAADGRTALVAIQTASIDVLVTDIVMPDAEGLELIQNISSRSPRIRILAISGGGQIDGQAYLRLAKELGADECLVKPFSLVEFLAKVLALARTVRSSSNRES